MEVLQTEHSLTKWNITRWFGTRLSYHAYWHWSYSIESRIPGLGRDNNKFTG
uniref:Uncharacterized protein n=1 Tax=Utricularia reniformis TaxID=192314 RepID=A0A1Y0B120_9LAMI|nr:hypothetical protein AEK19_MT0931 [Utricularia reniformis]ART31155.1 hypothetical protein AEK19_MT0931 [Utricularia reniformis]